MTRAEARRPHHQSREQGPGQAPGQAPGRAQAPAQRQPQAESPYPPRTRPPGRRDSRRPGGAPPRFPGVRRPSRGPDTARAATPPPTTTTETTATTVPAPRTPLPAPRPALPTEPFAERLLAVLSGRRPVHYMLGLTSGRAYDELAWLAERGPLRTPGTTSPVLREIGWYEARPGAIEVFARIGAGDRLHAMAFRLEQGPDRRWRCTAVDLGLPPRHDHRDRSQNRTRNLDLDR
ncbi:Rv3235 family protein [Streptomyces sp. NPDC048290]|uniref:Rv3235 family protein n=1 Tax=Streptomyces sp. NPDC048290 TaxID=3155811 RepID=UPI00343878B8